MDGRFVTGIGDKLYLPNSSGHTKHVIICSHWT